MKSQQRKLHHFSGQNRGLRNKENSERRLHGSHVNGFKNTVTELETYLTDQMRALVHARQEQWQALKDIRTWGELIASEDTTENVEEKYRQAIISWQNSRREGIDVRQRLLYAMSERAIPRTW